MLQLPFSLRSGPSSFAWRSFLASAFVAAAVHAQSPPSSPPTGTPVKAVIDLHLEPLQSIAAQGVYSIQSLQTTAPRAQDPPAPPRSEAGEGSTAARLLAHVNDARFDRDGRLVALLIEPPVSNTDSENVVRVLPAAAVRWHEARHQWVVVEPNLQFAELEAVSGTRSSGPSQNRQAPSGTTWLASQLVQASLDPVLAAEPALPDGRVKPADQPAVPSDTTRSAPVIWMAPSLQRLVLVVVPITVPASEGPATTRHVPVPWSLVTVVTASSGCHFRFSITPAVLAAGPAAANAAERPTASLRQRCYEHFLQATPSWDPAPSEQAAAPK
jgi:hypothetical protein